MTLMPDDDLDYEDDLPEDDEDGWDDDGYGPELEDLTHEEGPPF